VSLFLTGTDTGVGKTHTATCLLRLLRTTGLRCAGFKPICCGDRHDAELLLAASSDGLTIDDVNPIWLRTPAAPYPAALVENARIDPAQLVARLRDLQARFDFVLVEGVGGWLVPIRRDYFVSDLAVAMQLPVLVVAMNRLGCLNHAMLTVRAIAAERLPCAGVVLNTPNALPDHASTTNADVLVAIAGVSILPGLAAETSEVAPEWQAFIARLGVSASTPKRLDN
jgi:dethiobiotin synthetase